MGVKTKELRVGQKLVINTAARYPLKTRVGEVVTISDLSDEYVYIDGELVAGQDGKGPNQFDLYVEPAPKLDFTKPIETDNGTPVTIVSLKGRSEDYPVLAYIGSSDSISTFTADGFYHKLKGENIFNLRNVAEKRTGYINMYPDKGTNGTRGYIHATRAIADREAGKNRIGVTKVTLVAGQFDE